jgi:phosphatidylglycerol:prolipoprotein diacylglycerol transferase
MAGCCYGLPTGLPWGVRFTSPLAAEVASTPLGVVLHPVQLYESAAHLALFAALLALHGRRRFPGQVLASYFVLEGLARALLETWRGDGFRGTGWMGIGWMSTGRATSLLFLAIGALLLSVGRAQKGQDERRSLSPSA